MTLMWILLVAVSCIVIAINLLGALLLTKKENTQQSSKKELPKIAILIAARNEAKTLDRCLNALEQLNYPAELLSVWIGNDHSTDTTLEVALSRCRQYPHWQVLDIKEQWNGIRGKANVLAQLARAAEERADYFFITDADMAVVPDWIGAMLPHFTAKVAIVSGTSLVVGDQWFYSFQRYDWAIALGLTKAYSYLPKIGETLTVVGNNMAIRKEVYNAVGGYESIPFSITEDYELHRQVNKIGFTTFHSCSPATKAFTLPAGGVKELLNQRKRWMTGAMELPLPMVVILFLQALFLPSVAILIFFFPLTGILLYLAKLISQMLLTRQMLIRLREPPGFPLLAYDIYSFLLSISLLVFYFLPGPVRWKERSY